MGFKQSFVSIAVLATTVLASAPEAYTTIEPCHECCPTAAPEYVTVTEQYQVYPTCTPAYETHVLIHSNKNYASSTTSVVEVAKCTPTIYVSTTIPVYKDWQSYSSVVTYVDQPVTFSQYHYTQTYSTTHSPAAYTPPAKNYGYGSNATAPAYAAPTAEPECSTEYSYKTVSVENWADYHALGPIAITSYAGSGLCTDCGADKYGAYTQRLTVKYCEDSSCTTFPETWIARPQTYTTSASAYTVTVTDKYCETATPQAAIPGYYATAAGSYATEDCSTDANGSTYYAQPTYYNGGNGNGGTITAPYVTYPTGGSSSMGGSMGNSMGGNTDSSAAPGPTARVARDVRMQKRAGLLVAA